MGCESVMEGKILDTIIIGSGPAGLSAAVYAVRAGLEFVVIEANYASGGQVLQTSEVDNYLGFHNINGFDLGMKFREHADLLGATFVNKKVIGVSNNESVWLVKCDDGEIFRSRTLVAATGASSTKLNVAGEDEFRGRGVSYCATCDGNFFRGKKVAVVGGGDTALEDAIYLARICEKVYVIHRRDAFRGAKSLQNRLFELENVEVLWDSVVEEINGLDNVDSVIVRNSKMDMQGRIDVSGVFIAVGTTPDSELFKGICEMDERGYIIADENCITTCEGLFVAGDIRKKTLRQIVTAASDGANAINSVVSCLNGI